MPTLIAGGTVVTAVSTYAADVLCDGGRIVTIGSGLEHEGADRVDASGCYVFPGLIEVHSHLDTPWGTYTTVDDWASGSIGAACGAVTTIVDFALQGKGQPLRAAIDRWHEKAEGKAVVDYSFHAMVMDLTDEVRAEIPKLVEEGIPSFKVFMAYKGAVQADDETLLRTMLLAAEHGGLTMVHAENGDAIVVLMDRLIEAGKVGPQSWPHARPPELEAEAAHRAIVLAGIAEAPLYVVHTSASGAVAEIAAARARGQHVYGETCPQYLTQTIERYDAPDQEAAKVVMAPPLRERSHQAALWSGLASGALSVVGTDHSAWAYGGQKEHGLGDFRTMIQGAPGIEERVFTLWTHGVVAGRMSMNRFVEVTSTLPAKLFGLYPRKGDIAIGADADIVVWDPNATWTISVDELHGNTDYSLYEGMPVNGSPRAVLSRGETIVRDRQFVGAAGRGQFLRRAAFSAP